MLIETTLLFKTMLILSSQLGLVLLGCFYFIKGAHYAYENNTTLFGFKFRGSVNMKNQLDLVPYVDTFPREMVINDENGEQLKLKLAKNSDEIIKYLKEGYYQSRPTSGFFNGLGILWMITLGLTTLFASTGIATMTGVILFTIQSLLMGPLLGFIMLDMDENDGYRALKIVFFVTILTGIIGYGDFISFSESSFLTFFLFFGLLGLIIFNISRAFITMSRKKVRASAIFGAFLFSIFLLYDFNLVRKRQDMIDGNTWENAFELAFAIYLDIINLLLEILEAMGNS